MTFPFFSIRPFTSIDREQWDALFQRSRSRNVFYDHAYISAINEVLPAGYQFRQVITLEDNGELVLVQPVAWQFSMMGKVLQFFQPFYGDHVEPLCDPAQREQYLKGLIGFVSRQSGVDLVWGNALSSSFAGFLLDHWPMPGQQVLRRHTILEMELPDALESFWAGYKSNFRSTLRRRIRAAEKEGMQVHYVEAGSEGDLAAQQQSLRALRGLHLKRWAGNLFGATDFSLPLIQTFHQHFLEQQHHGLTPLFIEIRHGGQVVASNYVLKSPEHMIFYHHCFDPDYRSFGMGDLLAFYSIEYGIRKKLQRVDFKRGEEVYKTKWTGSSTENFDFLLPLTLKGRMIARQQGWMRQLRDNKTMRSIVSWIRDRRWLKEAASKSH